MTRPDWDQYFLDMLPAVAARGTCDRKRVGAILVDEDHRITATGFNGAPRGLGHCDDPAVGHLMKEIDGRESCIRTLHAESNAIDYAGRDAEGCTLYITCTPCYDCAKRIINVGIVRVVYAEHYESRNTGLTMRLLHAGGVEALQVKEEDEEDAERTHH